MSEYDDFTDDEEISQAPGNPLRARMKELESEAKVLRQQALEHETIKRELAFVRAGIDPTDAAAKYFVKGYDGDLSQEAIKQAAIEARLLSHTISDEEISEQKAWGKTNQVAAGAGSSSELPSLDARLNAAKSSAEVLEIWANEHNQ
jgi:hypothetical protein